MENDMDTALDLLARWMGISLHHVVYEGRGHPEPLFGQTRDLLAAHGIDVVWDAKDERVLRRHSQAAATSQGDGA